MPNNPREESMILASQALPEGTVCSCLAYHVRVVASETTWVAKPAKKFIITLESSRWTTPGDGLELTNETTSLWWAISAIIMADSSILLGRRTMEIIRNHGDHEQPHSRPRRGPQPSRHTRRHAFTQRLGGHQRQPILGVQR